MELEHDINKVWSEFLTSDWLGAAGNSQALQDLAALTAETLKTLGGEIDLLRRELVAKDINVSQ